MVQKKKIEVKKHVFYRVVNFIRMRAKSWKRKCREKWEEGFCSQTIRVLIGSLTELEERQWSGYFKNIRILLKNLSANLYWNLERQARMVRVPIIQDINRPDNSAILCVYAIILGSFNHSVIHQPYFKNYSRLVREQLGRIFMPFIQVMGRVTSLAVVKTRQVFFLLYF